MVAEDEVSRGTPGPSSPAKPIAATPWCENVERENKNKFFHIFLL